MLFLLFSAQDCLDNFKDQSEFGYISKDSPDSDNTKGHDEKWWIPKVKVPPDGLSEASRRFLQYQKDCVNQVLKAAMAINAQVLFEMEIPESYIDSLPKVNTMADSIQEHLEDQLLGEIIRENREDLDVNKLISIVYIFYIYIRNFSFYFQI